MSYPRVGRVFFFNGASLTVGMMLYVSVPHHPVSPTRVGEAPPRLRSGHALTAPQRCPKTRSLSRRERLALAANLVLANWVTSRLEIHPAPYPRERRPPTTCATRPNPAPTPGHHTLGWVPFPSWLYHLLADASATPGPTARISRSCIYPHIVESNQRT